MIRSTQTIQELYFIIRQYSTEFDGFVLSIAFSKLASLNSKNGSDRQNSVKSKALELLATRVFAIRMDASRPVSSIIWSLAKLRYHPDGELVRHMSEHAASMVGSFQPRDISTTLWASRGIWNANKDSRAI